MATISNSSGGGRSHGLFLRMRELPPVSFSYRILRNRGVNELSSNEFDLELELELDKEI